MPAGRSCLSKPSLRIFSNSVPIAHNRPTAASFDTPTARSPGRHGVDYRKARLLSWDLQELFRLYAKGIVRSLRSRGIDPETASDLAQDAFLKVLASPPPASAASHNPKSYLYTVARNLSIDHYRRERSLRRVDLPQNAFDAIIDPSPSAETIVYDRQRLQLVEQALAELPRRVREAFQLHRMGGLTISEVAQKLGMSTTRTWVLIRDAYEHIEDRLNGL
nr:RNA polymerase sigma factor [Agrobacterium deltaense]